MQALLIQKKFLNSIKQNKRRKRAEHYYRAVV